VPSLVLVVLLVALVVLVVLVLLSVCITSGASTAGNITSSINGTIRSSVLVPVSRNNYIT
jgi:preprotein translocase subunit SecG